MGNSNMRSKLASVAAVFIPLGFLGGLFEKNIGQAFGSAVTWAIIWQIIRPKY
jgi:hypothetical protein